MKKRQPLLQKKKKSAIQEWLRSKAISYDENGVKALLLLKVKDFKNKYDRYVVDEMAREKGVQVIRLPPFPPYHCELNPIELIWAQVKGYVAENNTTFKMSQVKPLMHQALDAVTAKN